LKEWGNFTQPRNLDMTQRFIQIIRGIFGYISYPLPLRVRDILSSKMTQYTPLNVTNYLNGPKGRGLKQRFSTDGSWKISNRSWANFFLLWFSIVDFFFKYTGLGAIWVEKCWSKMFKTLEMSLMGVFLPENSHKRKEENWTCAIDERQKEDENEKCRAVIRTQDLRGYVPEWCQQNWCQFRQHFMRNFLCKKLWKHWFCILQNASRKTWLIN